MPKRPHTTTSFSLTPSTRFWSTVHLLREHKLSNPVHHPASIPKMIGNIITKFATSSTSCREYFRISSKTKKPKESGPHIINKIWDEVNDDTSE
ncbi:MAG TPA: hypothetical protein DCE42_05735 [Myxococcales bacterium]|nr:hypothetical protein [Myxococcales bacterium]